MRTTPTSGAPATPDEQDAGLRQAWRQVQRKLAFALTCGAAVLAGALGYHQLTGADVAAVVMVTLPMLGHLGSTSFSAVAVYRGQVALAATSAGVERTVALAAGAVATLVGVPAVVALVGGLLVGQVCAVGVLLWRLGPLGPRLGLEAMTPSALLRQWRETASFGVNNVATDIGQIHLVIIGALAGTVAVGEYAAALRLMMLLGLVTNSVSTLLLRDMSRPGTRSLATLWQTVALVTGAVSAAAAVIAVWPSFIVGTVFGSSFEQAAGPARAFCVGAVMLAVTQPLGAYLQAVGERRLVAALALGTAAWSCAAVAAGAALAGATGAAAGGVVSAVPTIYVYLRRIRRRQQSWG